MAQQWETSNAEERVEYVGHIARTVWEAASFCILAGQYELLQLLGAYPMQASHNGQAYNVLTSDEKFNNS